MKLTLKRNATYVPEWNGNRDLPVADQIKVEFDYLTTADKEGMLVGSGQNVGSIAKQVWLSKVNKITNLEIEIDGKIVEATPENILNMPDTFELFTEVSTHLFEASSLTKEEIKN